MMWLIKCYNRKQSLACQKQDILKPLGFFCKMSAKIVKNIPLTHISNKSLSYV